MANRSEVETRLKEMVERLQPLEPLKIVLFGSWARGDADDWSDLDVMVVARNVADVFGERLRFGYSLIRPRYGLDLLVYTPHEFDEMKRAENPFIEAIEQEGRVLYERPAA